MCPSFQDQYPTSTNAIYQAAAKLWQPWLKPSSLQTLREGRVTQYICERENYRQPLTLQTLIETTYGQHRE